MSPEKPTTGDTVKTGWVRTGQVKKVKPDGTRVIKTKVGSLKEEKNPHKPIKTETDRESE